MHVGYSFVPRDVSFLSLFFSLSLSLSLVAVLVDCSTDEGKKDNLCFLNPSL